MIELLLNAESALALGLLDQAERIYRTVLEADPRNGIAAVGLSRVALERGDDAGAHALARAALEIDPENATARRMIDRLEEVARYRDAAASQAMNPAFAVTEAGADPGSDAIRLPVAPAAPLPAAERVPEPGPPPPPAAVPQAAPARRGLLRRILGRS